MGNGNSRSAAGRIFRISRTLTLVGALVVSLAVNATLFVGGVIYDVVDTFVENVTGLQTASALQRQAMSKLQGQNRQLRGQVQTVRTANRQLRGQVQTARSANRQLQREVRTTVEQTRKRLQGSAVRSVATLPGRALPIAGTAVSVAITGLLIKDLCDAMKDLNGIEKAARPPAETESTETEVCSVSVPTKEKVWTDIKTSPKTVWEKSREFAPDLPSWSDLPDLDVIPGLQEKWRSIIRWLE